MKAPCPGCKVELDYASVPAYSAAKQMSGKFCPFCNHPLDPETAKKESLDYGAASAAIMEARVKGAEAFVAACTHGPTAPGAPEVPATV